MKRCNARSSRRAHLCAVLEEQRLDTGIHYCAAFDCGVPALKDYLREFASQHRRRGVSQTYVLVDGAAPKHVYGYYTLNAVQLEAESRAAVWEIADRFGRRAMSQGSAGSGGRCTRRRRALATT
jgi:hypothetical protein